MPSCLCPTVHPEITDGALKQCQLGMFRTSRFRVLSLRAHRLRHQQTTNRPALNSDSLHQARHHVPKPTCCSSGLYVRTSSLLPFSPPPSSPSGAKSPIPVVQPIPFFPVKPLLTQQFTLYHPQRDTRSPATEWCVSEKRYTRESLLQTPGTLLATLRVGPKTHQK